ncbi:alpha-L-arabinofuranosidase B [Lecanosticta acicola]|uniref:Octanoyltransferase n=1 Tax=Lecanosticta acicola TaxID=111012 RepID=A0AAI8W1Q0_9PEZI|nr:alpha-L-arabinofuranosidase B [Lecanosticta acicola]
MILRHLHLPGVVPYTSAAKIQDRLVSKLLAHKASPKTISPPDPTIITAQFQPVYTCGRREVGAVTEAQKQYLTQQTPWGKAEFHEAQRGGQTTFHGPGQLVAYPIIDLKRHHLTARCYVRHLEKTVISLLGNDYGIGARTTDDPGVWTDDTHKICAVGVHLRRNVSSHGIGLNVNTELGWLDRIVACGLEGKKTTSLEWQGVTAGLDVEYVGRLFIRRFCEGLEGVEAVQRIRETDID